MNAQEIFDKVTTHLITQNKESETDGACAYRGTNNTSCAVGCLISDEDYVPEMEGKTVAGLINAGFLPLELIPYGAILRYLQRVHDLNDVCQWRPALLDVADLFKLSVPDILKS